MGLTSTSTGTKLLNDDFNKLSKLSDFTIALAGNPNVGKSTVFNALTGMHQHTGNWPGKTVANAAGVCNHNSKKFLLVDLPGTYSLMSNSAEEEIARNYICFGKTDCIVVVVDATSLERNLNLVYQILEITNKVVVCVNLLDEAKSKGIKIDLNKLSHSLGVPVVGTIAKKKKTLKKLMDTVLDVCCEKIKPTPTKTLYPEIIEESISIIQSAIPKNEILNSKWIALKLIEGNEQIIKSTEKFTNLNLHTKSINKKLNEVNKKLEENNITITDVKDKIVSSIVFSAESIFKKVVSIENNKYRNFDRKIDKILTSKLFGIPIMLLFLGLIFWLTIVGANYPSQILSDFFGFLENKLLYYFEFFNAPEWLTNVLVLGMFKTLTWIIAVMLPPMAIFFPLFTILEDLGYLPRIAFNLDNFFRKACTTGKQALTMCMGFGCNAAGVIGCRIIDSPRERLIAIITNSLVPCNGRYPFLIIIATIFFGGMYSATTSTSIIATFSVLLVILLGIFMTLIISKILSKTILKGVPSSFILELPPYRKPQVGKILIRSIFDRTLFVLGRAIAVAAPAGIIIWLFANIDINNVSLLTHVAMFLDPFAKLMGLDGYILTAFILGLPANEIVLPIILMSYMAQGSLVDLEEISSIGNILIQNGWTILTAINVMIFTLLHFPCTTTLITIKKETGSYKWAGLAFLIPTVCGIVLCMATTLVYNVFIV